jgi:hypothetical protein
MELTKRHLQELQDAMDNKAIDITADGMIYEALEGEVRYREIIHLESLIEALEAA